MENATRKGALRTAVNSLALMLADSPHFQQEVSKYTTDEALTRVYKGFTPGTPKTDHLPRPWALIAIGEHNSTRIAGGSYNVFENEGFLILWLCSEVENRDDLSESLLAFADWTYEVIADLQNLAGADDFLNIIDIQQENVPGLDAPESGAEVPYCMATWRLQWSRY